MAPPFNGAPLSPQPALTLRKTTKSACSSRRRWENDRALMIFRCLGYPGSIAFAVQITLLKMACSAARTIRRQEGEGTMTTYTADISWTLASGEEFLKGRYSRGHILSFDGGTVVPASASPHVVGKWAVEAAVDPEEMLVAALSDCHMLSFLHVARLAGFTVAAYRDHAEGLMEEISPGKQAMTRVVLHPQIEWIGEVPEEAKLKHIHHEAHEVCFIANSVKTNVTVA
jgi:organic hydroperoxide reductase OsmC/OhrA